MAQSVRDPTQEPSSSRRVGWPELLPSGALVAPQSEMCAFRRRRIASRTKDCAVMPRLQIPHPPRRRRSLTASLRQEILATVPRLRAFAVSLTASSDRADDLVQETMLRALTHIDQFQPGTNMRAWLFTILRNQFNSEYRQRRWVTEDSDGIYVDALKTVPQQSSWLEFQELRMALGKLSAEQREAVVLVGASGMTYEEAAEICGCAIGTIKSRVNRGRTRLAELLSIETIDDFGPDRENRAVLSSGRSP